MLNLTALETYLEPFSQIFKRPKVNEISINRPFEMWIEEGGKIYKEDIATDFEHLRGLAALIAQATDQKISEENPLLSATLPTNGYRVQIVIPPACKPGSIGISIRKSSTIDMTLESYEKEGAFKETTIGSANDQDTLILQSLLKERKIKEFLRQAVISRKNIIVSGGTSTGKTTFTNAMLQEIPKNERLITCEDTPEINLSNHENCLNLFASKGGQGRAKVTIQDLIEACLRLRPDRIIVGELRGTEAFSFLRAINTGHPGSISTLHADTPKMALAQLKLMVMQAGLGLPAEQVEQYILQVIEIVVQLKRGLDGRRFVSEIYYSRMD